MFRILRNNMKKILLVTILLIVPPFVIWGVGGMGDDGSSKVVGKIYGKKVTMAQYMQARDACMLNLYLLYGPNFRDLLPMVDLNRQTWDRLLLLAKASKAGVVISDQEVAGQIEKLFRRGDAYDAGRYAEFLQQAGLPALVFEQRIRDTLSIGRLSRLVTDTTLVTNSALQEAYLVKGEKVKATYVTLHASAYESKIAADESEEKAFFETHGEKFRVPEQVRVRYVLLSPDRFKKELKVTDAEMRDYFDLNQASYKDSKTGKVQPFDKVKDNVRQQIIAQKAENLAFEKATDISMALFDQPSLEKVAKAAGLDILVPEAFTANTQAPPLQSREFVQAAFATDVGKNSAVVKTTAGYALLSPMEKNPSHVPAWEQVKDQVRVEFRKDQARLKMIQESQKIREELVRALADRRGDFTELAASLGLDVKTTGLFSRDTVLDNLPEADRFKQACFETAMGALTPALNAADAVIIAHVDKRQAGTLENFEKEKDTLRAELLAHKKEGLLNSWYGLVRKEARLEDLTHGVGIR